MLGVISGKISAGFARKGIIAEKDIEAYSYGFEILISEIIGWSIIAILMIILHKYYETLIFFGTYILIRIHAGGYHANSHLKCFLLFSISYVAIMLVGDIIPVDVHSICVIGIAIINAIIIYMLAPIEHKNNVHSAKVVERKRKYSVTYSSILSIASIIFVFMKLGNVGLYIALTLLFADISLLLAFLQKSNYIFSGRNE